MFQLTQRERLLVACILAAFLLGLAVKHYREQVEPSAPRELVDAKH